MRNSSAAVLNVPGFAVGLGVAAFLIRLLVIPAGLAGTTSGIMIAEGGIVPYVLRAFLFGVFCAIAGAITAAIHNEFAKRS